jgi:hypothetical protein
MGAGSEQVASDTALSVTCDTWSVLKHLVMTSDCIGLSTEHGVREEIASGRIVVVDSSVAVPAGQNAAALLDVVVQELTNKPAPLP